MTKLHTMYKKFSLYIIQYRNSLHPLGGNGGAGSEPGSLHELRMLACSAPSGVDSEFLSGSFGLRGLLSER